MHYEVDGDFGGVGVHWRSKDQAQAVDKFRGMGPSLGSIRGHFAALRPYNNWNFLISRQLRPLLFLQQLCTNDPFLPFNTILRRLTTLLVIPPPSSSLFLLFAPSLSPPFSSSRLLRHFHRLNQRTRKAASNPKSRHRSQTRATTATSILSIPSARAFVLLYLLITVHFI